LAVAGNAIHEAADYRRNECLNIPEAIALIGTKAPREWVCAFDFTFDLLFNFTFDNQKISTDLWCLTTLCFDYDLRVLWHWASGVVE
jgi:hypothetical protein